MESTNLVKNVFLVLMCAIIMGLLYQVFFEVPIESDGVKVEGVLQYSAMKMEYPISKYYYSYCYLPYAHMEDDIDMSLGLDLKSSISNNLNKIESDLSSSSSDNVILSGYCSYTTGWK